MLCRSHVTAAARLDASGQSAAAGGGGDQEEGDQDEGGGEVSSFQRDLGLEAGCRKQNVTEAGCRK